jgi:SurA N-terminal domain
LFLPKFALRYGLVLLTVILTACGSGSGTGSAKSAAIVDGTAIPLSAYNTQVTILREQATTSSSTGVDPCSGPPSFAPFCHQLKQQALNTLIDQQLVTEYARDHHISVSNADFNGSWLQYINSAQFKGNMAVVRAYARKLRVTVADLKTFLRAKMLHDLVSFHVTRNMSQYAPSTRLSRLLAATPKELHADLRLLKRSSFLETLALILTNHSSLCAQQACGEMGWQPNAFIPSNEHALTTARVGKVVGPFASQQSFSLFLVEGHEPHRLLTSGQQLSLRERLFAKWLTKREKQASVRRYVAA